MTQRFNGTSWSITPSLNASATGYSQLNRVDATSASNVWAIGSDTQAGTLVHRYNGTSWVAMSSPAGVAPRGLDVISPTEVWVAGYAGSSATVTQWKNGTWTTRYTQASTGRHLTVFEAIAVDTSGKVWAVGWDRDYNAPGRPVSSLVVHFDGNSWKRESTPNPANRNTLTDVVALANGEVFAVGVAQDTSGGGITPGSLMLRRQADGWSSLIVPHGEAGSQDQLQGVEAVSSTSIWAVGVLQLAIQWPVRAAAGALDGDRRRHLRHLPSQSRARGLRPCLGRLSDLGRQSVGGWLHVTAIGRERHADPEGDGRSLNRDPAGENGAVHGHGSFSRTLGLRHVTPGFRRSRHRRG
jgi:hypothetical protein